jgi:hypothetical protein
MLLSCQVLVASPIVSTIESPSHNSRGKGLMMTKLGGQTASRQKFNWLKDLDRRAASPGVEVLWRRVFAGDWCPLFIMTRFPTFVQFILEESMEQIWAQEKALLQSPNGIRVLSGLTNGQKCQLLSLIHDVRRASEYYKLHRNSAKSDLRLTQGAPKTVRKLVGKVGALQSKLRELRDYAGSVQYELGWEYKVSAEKCLEILESPQPGAVCARFLRSIRRNYHSKFERPITRGVVQLFWFFNYECRLSGRESQVRAAIVADECLGVKYSYQASYKDAESQGCPAIKKDVDRFRPRTNR